jgi:hypothetical protein
MENVPGVAVIAAIGFVVTVIFIAITLARFAWMEIRLLILRVRFRLKKGFWYPSKRRKS